MMNTGRKVFIWIVSLIGIAGICIFVYFIITVENKYPPIAALISFSLAFIVALNTLFGAAHKNEKNVKPNEQVYYRYISDSTYRKINIIGVIATIIGVTFAIIGGGGILGWYQMLKLSVPQAKVNPPVSEEEDSGVTATPPIIKAITKPETNNPEGSTPKKEEFVATGESGYQLNEGFALESAEEYAINKLSRRLNMEQSDINMQAQAPQAPCWFSQPPICRNSDFAYAAGMGTGDPGKIRNKADADALKRYSAEVRGVQLPDATFKEIEEKGLENAQIEGRPVQYRVVRQIFENNNYYILLLLPRRFSTGLIYYPDEVLCDQRTGNFAKAEPAKTGTSSPMIGYQSPTDFEFVVTQNGKFTISLETRTERLWFALYDKYGTQLMPSETPGIIAGRYDKTASGAKRDVFADGRKVNRCIWSPTNIFEGSFTFILDAGTYYLRFIRSETGSSEVGLTTQFVAFR